MRYSDVELTANSPNTKGLVINYEEGGLQNGKIATPKLFALQNTSRHGIPFYASLL